MVGSSGEAGGLLFVFPLPVGAVPHATKSPVPECIPVDKHLAWLGHLLSQRQEDNKQQDKVIASTETCTAFLIRRSLIKAYLQAGSMLHPEHTVFIFNL